MEPVSATAAPVLGAGPLNVTVTPRLLPPVSEEVETPTETTVSGTRLTDAVLDELPSVAVMVAVCDVVTEPVVAAKVAVVALAATETEVGTVRVALLSDS